MTPLRITATMATAIVYYGDGLHLDGPLSYGAYLELPPAEKESLPPIVGPWAVDFALPLARWACEAVLPPYADPRLFVEPPERDGAGVQHGRVWGWCASAACAAWLCEDQIMTNKRPPLDDYARLSMARSVQISSGRHKAWRKPYPARYATSVTWYALGDRDRVEYLLTQAGGAGVDAIGKTCNHGNGRVLGWSVETVDEDWSIMRGDQLMRVMPLAYGHGEPGTATIRAPYHHRSRSIPASIPDYEELRP